LDELLTTRQLQEILQVDRITIYRMLADGRLRGFKVGGQWRFPRHLIEAWLQNQQVQWSVEEEQVSSEYVTAPHEALPLRCIQAIQDILAQAGGIGTLTISPDGQPLTDMSNPPPFCKLLLETEEGRVRCRQSWRDSRPHLRGRRGEGPGGGGGFRSRRPIRAGRPLEGRSFR